MLHVLMVMVIQHVGNNVDACTHCAYLILNMGVRFYNELHNLSTADFYENRKASVQGEFYEIERVISKRIRKGKVLGIYIWFLRYIFCLT